MSQNVSKKNVGFIYRVNDVPYVINVVICIESDICEAGKKYEKK